jgi:putative exosortase-associated protein (TIGR04073 family)
VVAAALVFLLAAPGDAQAQTAARKAGRGLAAMTTCFLEVPGNMYREGERNGAGGVAFGFAKGLGMIVPRVLVGVYELVTAPVPAPAGFRPILQPEYPWGYFE